MNDVDKFWGGKRSVDLHGERSEIEIELNFENVDGILREIVVLHRKKKYWDTCIMLIFVNWVY